VTGLPPAVGVFLIIVGVIGMLTAGGVLVADRYRRRVNGPTDSPDASLDTDLDVLLAPRTTALPVIAPRHRPPGDLFTEYDGPLTPEPDNERGK
jgi:hypothetical protein